MNEQESGKRAAGAPATIYDIAKLAGVNPSTVSRALTTPGRISAKTEEKIRAAAAELNYRVNPFARALPTGRTRLLAVTIADITNPVFFDVVRGAEQVAGEAGYTLVIAESQESSTNEASALERILPMVDGVILATTRLSDDEIRAINSDKPVILMNRVVDGVENVVPDTESGISEAMQHLASLGHKQIAFLGGPSASWMNGKRWESIVRQALELGVSAVEIGPNPPTLEAGRAALDRVRVSGVTAVIAYNDLMAIGLLQAATDAGIRVPDDLSIVGFDNSFGSDFTSPGLTTVRQPLLELGSQAVRNMLAGLDASDAGVETPLSTDSLRTSLVVRGSTGQARTR